MEGELDGGGTCKVNLSNDKRLLHVHHKNSEKSDNREKNLVAFCVECHSKQAGHEHIHVSTEERLLLKNLRVL